MKIKMKNLLPFLAVVSLLAVGCQSSDGMMVESGRSMDSEMTEMSEPMAAEEYLVTIEVRRDSPTPLAPVAWAVHEGANPFLISEMGEKLPGLEALAEDGDPGPVSEALAALMDVHDHGVAAVPEGSGAPGPAAPGSAYSFTVTVPQGARLSFATMYVQSNDLFFSPGEEGLPLTGDMALSGDVTVRIKLFDAGTEVNEEPGTGPHQPPRQPMANSGQTESRPITEVDGMDTMHHWGEVSSVVRVTLDHGKM